MQYNLEPFESAAVPWFLFFLFFLQFLFELKNKQHSELLNKSTSYFVPPLNMMLIYLHHISSELPQSLMVKACCTSLLHYRMFYSPNIFIFLLLICFKITFVGKEIWRSLKEKRKMNQTRLLCIVLQNCCTVRMLWCFVSRGQAGAAACTFYSIQGPMSPGARGGQTMGSG